MLLEPRYLEKPWGGRRLERAFGRALPGSAPVGESWELFDRPAGSSTVRNGPLRGRTLSSLRGGRELPLLLKILDVQDRLSVQVHPNAAVARGHGTEAKSEAWVVLEADPGARIWKGFRDGVTDESFRGALADGKAEECLHSFEPRAGDVVVVAAGTVHAAGGGLLLAEIQQSSETTYRLHDWGRAGAGGRPRELHVDAALEAARFGPREPDRVVPRELEDDGNLRRLLLFATRWFSAEHLTFAGTATLETGAGGEGDGGPDPWSAVLFLSGEGRVRAFDRRAEPAPFRPGDTVLLPAARDAWEIEPASGKVVQALLFRP
jgi:mannose-6-phosphate isomerase